MGAASLALPEEDETNCEDIIGQQPAARLFSHRYRRPSSPKCTITHQSRGIYGTGGVCSSASQRVFVVARDAPMMLSLGRLSENRR
jgi:hypothetical protein